MNHSSNRNQDSKSRSNSKSSKSRSRSRSRSPSLQNESKINNNPHERQKNNGKLYLANIPINIPQQRIKQEYENDLLTLKVNKTSLITKIQDLNKTILNTEQRKKYDARK